MCKDKEEKPPGEKGPRAKTSVKNFASKILGFFSSGKSLQDNLPPRPTLSSIIGIIRSWTPKRPMKYPYTMGAKVIQFPYKFYYQNNWIWRYYPYGILGSVPVFWYLSSLANSPSNVATWAEKRRKEREEGH
ncbi:uncharacterized protein LOC135136512 [Zophobas morio]|uniref:uncharacterized protein LOC135136512 n=1 Tax=Zophobas morio TaxID=2755281 RepID=UPI003082E935